MVLTNIPWGAGTRESKRRARTDLINAELSPRYISEHAKFLSEKDRVCGPEGFLDAKRSQYHYELNNSLSSSATAVGNANAVRSPRRSYSSASLVGVRQSAAESKKKYLKTLHAIDEFVIHAKQEERELKRMEGDIIKEQQTLRANLKQFESDLSKKKYGEERKLASQLTELDELKTAAVKNKFKVFTKRLKDDLSGSVDFKIQDFKSQSKINSVSHKYRTTLEQLELTRMEMDRVIEDYQTKLRAKEAQQHELQKQLGDLAVAVNMEAYKNKKIVIERKSRQRRLSDSRVEEDRSARQKLDSSLEKGDHEVRGAFSQFHKFDGQLKTTKDKLFSQNRDRDRQLQDIRIRLKKNRRSQQDLGKQNQLINFDIAKEEQNENVERHSERRTQQMSKWLTERQQAEQSSEERLLAAAQNWQMATQIVKHEEAVQHMDRIVQQCTNEEKSLLNEFRDSDLRFQNAAQEVHKVQSQLLETRRKNAEKVKKELLGVNNEEEGILQVLFRKQAEMNKLLAKRSWTYQRLQQQVAVNREQKHTLEHHSNELEHSRRIQAATSRAVSPSGDDAK